MFGPILRLREQTEKARVSDMQTKLAAMLAKLTPEAQDAALKAFVAYVAHQSKSNHIERLVRLLEAMVQENTVQAR
jgi:hypothetical protein